MNVSGDNEQFEAQGEHAVNAMTHLSLERLKERERTKRLLIGVVAVLTIVAAVAMIFAPAGREIQGYVIGSVLLVLALGAIGSSKFLLKLPAVRIDTRDTPLPPMGTSRPIDKNARQKPSRFNVGK